MRHMDKGLKSTHDTDAAPRFLPRSAASDQAWPIRKEALGIIGRLAALFILLCTGCQGPRPATLPKPSASQRPGVLGTADVVRVSFTGAPELNQSQRIGTEGKLSLPLVGEVYAAGKSVGQLQKELAGLY